MTQQDTQHLLALYERQIEDLKAELQRSDKNIRTLLGVMADQQERIEHSIRKPTVLEQIIGEKRGI